MSEDGLIGAWIAHLDGGAYFLNFSSDRSFQGMFQLPAGTSIFFGNFDLDERGDPQNLTLQLRDGIGKNGDRLGGRTSADKVEAIVKLRSGEMLFYAPPPEIGGRPSEFPDGEPGFYGANLFLNLQRAGGPAELPGHVAMEAK